MRLAGFFDSPWFFQATAWLQVVAILAIPAIVFRMARKANHRQEVARRLIGDRGRGLGTPDVDGWRPFLRYRESP